MGNSPLVVYTALSPNHSGRRNHAIDTITPHYMGGNCSIETCGQIFAPTSRQASSNYGIDSDGRVGMYVEEGNRAWTSGSGANDHRAVTIECANLADGSLTNSCWQSLVNLCADICRRNGKTRLVYRGSANYGGLASTDMLLTMHKWFQSTDCPGPWLSKQFGRLASEVSERLGGQVKMISIADVAARIHYDMVTDERNGYSQGSRWGGQTGQTKTLTIGGRKYTYKLGDYDCASSVITAWQIALQGTKYEGSLDGATYTGDMEAVFVASGLFTSKLSTAKRGDLYLTARTATQLGHTAMCQDGGGDGVFGRDCLSEFLRNEHGTATGGKVGDQDGGEAVFRDYYDFQGCWQTVLHYNGKADYYAEDGTPTPKQTVKAVKRGVHRVYDKASNRHHWTSDASEAQKLVDVGWTYEGIAWKSSAKGTKVHRLYDKGSGDHLLTTSAEEALGAIGMGWAYEGVAFLAGGKTPVYRLYDPKLKEHFYTTSATEKKTCLGWMKDEGIAFKV